jgi:DNA-binding FadR family transcriptional regulator
MILFLRGSNKGVDLGKVLEFRRLLEVEMAGLAALRRTDEDLQEMQTILDQASTSSVECDPVCFAKWDVEFHAAMARATHNEIMLLVLDSLVDIMLGIREASFVVPDTPERAFRYHRAIYEQIQAGDPERARQAMQAHLAETEDTMHKALSLQADEQSQVGGRVASKNESTGSANQVKPNPN